MTKKREVALMSKQLLVFDFYLKYSDFFNNL